MEYGVREIEERDIRSICNYWLNNDPVYLRNLGVDLDKLPSQEGLESMLKAQMSTAFERKRSYALIWTDSSGHGIGHCNINDIDFGKSAFLHLHIWNKIFRQKGLGTLLLKKSIPIFFEKLSLEILYSQPMASNEAPHKALEKAGFCFVRQYTTIPGSLNSKQEVKLWEFRREYLP
ncbi:MAG: GNAT family N-acetyltransferase [Bacteroidia bacterium]|nr:GNAT family N-acetyltransferase [Bacteroidia bacterium]